MPVLGQGRLLERRAVERGQPARLTLLGRRDVRPRLRQQPLNAGQYPVILRLRDRPMEVVEPPLEQPGELPARRP
jgi:hypothetical protein